MIETVFAVMIAAVLTTTIYQGLAAHRVQSRKAFETSVALDFAQSYLELLRNQPYDSIAPGARINPLYDTVRVPAAGTWDDLLQDHYFILHPDLAWLTARGPQLNVVISEQNGADGSRCKHIALTVRWERLRVGPGAASDTVPGLSLQLDAVVYRSFR